MAESWFRIDLLTYEIPVERLPGGILTVAKDTRGAKAWGAHAKKGFVRYFPVRGAAKKALKMHQRFRVEDKHD